LKIENEKEKEDVEVDRAKKKGVLEAKKQKTVQCQADHETKINATGQEQIEQAAIEKAEFDRVMQANRQAREIAREKAEATAEEHFEYGQELGREVERVWRTRLRNPSKIAKEEQEFQYENDEYLARIDRLKQERIEILRNEGVPEQYLREIQGNRFDLK
jgi:hypothetical protein